MSCRIALMTVLLSLSPCVRAGYTAVTTTDAVSTSDDNGNGAADPGETFATLTSGSFQTYTPDGPSDPHLWGGDLDRYRYALSGAVASVSGPVVAYSGRYVIFYDSDKSLTYNPGDFYISLGDFNLSARYDASEPGADLEGLLLQTKGPETPPFRDLGYCGPVQYTGRHTPATTGPGGANTGFIQGTLRCPAVPEPSTALLFALGAPLLALRRRAG